MKKLYWLIAVMLVMILFFQCNKDLNATNEQDPDVPVISDPVNTSLQGNITNENDQPAAGVAVTAGDSTVITDIKGYFRFASVTLDKNVALVTAVKEGYFKGYRVFAAVSGQNQIAIKLIKKELAGTVAASSGGEVTLSNGSKIALAANGVLTASSNNAYNDDIKVYSSYIDPKNSDNSKEIPGSSMANDIDKKRVVLSSYGMLAVELASASGEKLQIKSGSTATLTIPISSVSVASAPVTIPLWYLDETTGIWQEEGMATKQGSNYVGDVKHFSYWSAAYPQATVTLSMTLQTPDNLPLIHQFVDISGFLTDTSTSVTTVYYGYSDSSGQIKTQVPAGIDLSIKVFGTCGGTVIDSEAVSSLTQDKDLGIIKVEDNTSFLLTFNGKLVNCNNEPVTNGYAIIEYNGVRKYAFANASGEFTTTFASCFSGLNFFISGVDVAGEKQSQQKEMSSAMLVTDVGTIVVCGSAADEQYINYKIDGVSYNISNTNGDSLGAIKLSSSDVQIYGYTLPSQSTYISFQTSPYGIGMNIPMRALSFNAGDSVQRTPSILTLINTADSVNQYYEGNFSGDYMDSNMAHTISATFRVKQN